MSPKAISLLSQTSLFGGLDSDDLIACAHAFREKHLNKGQCLERGAFRDLWATRPALVTGVVTFLCRRLRQMTGQFESVALERLDVRLARFILSTLGTRSARPGRRIPIELGFSQSELSQLLGASRPKVNAAMAWLEKTGAIKRTSDRLFCDPEKLARIAQSGDDA